MALAGRFSIPTIIPSIFSIPAVSGLFIILVGDYNPFLFALAVAPATVAISMLRPPSMNILLEQGKKDTGAASSLMNFSFPFMGSLGVLFISMDWDNWILVFGLMDLIAGMGCLVFWQRAWKRCLGEIRNIC